MWNRLQTGILLGLAIAVLGCGPGGFSWGRDADGTAYYQRAKRAAEARDFDSALELYKKALRVNPQLADAHMEIGVLYEDKKKDPIAAIYHYQQFLELEPHSGKRQVVQDFIERAKVALLTSLPQAAMLDGDSSARLQAEKTNLTQENAMLQARVTELEKSLAERATQEILRSSENRPAPPPAEPVMAAAPPPPPAHTGRTHVVQPKDTLQSLALKYYGTRSDWQKIFEANRQTLASKDQLKVGQPLVIP